MVRLFTITLFLSAFLLFWVQPLVAKLLLPFLGGSPTVWNVSVCFFQAMLLGGYAWAHWLSKRASIQIQTAVHAVSLLAAASVLPFRVAADATQSLSSGADPSLWLLTQLALICGLPFFLLSANSPLLQRWFAVSGHRDARDPYFLFAASNIGSFLALIAFPFLLEPNLHLAWQSQAWMVGFVGLAALIAGCGWTVRRREVATASEASPARETPSPVSQSLRLKWVWQAFLPSSLMLGVTQFLTTDVATIPLLWVLPLAIYLLTFVVAFGKSSVASNVWLSRLLPILTIAVLFTIMSNVNDPIWILFPLHLVLLTVAGLVCHGRLAKDRPPVESLTEFYFWLSLGGVLGGVFNGLLAPVLFDRVAEYPLVLVGLALLAENRVAATESKLASRIRWSVAPLLGVLTVALMAGSQSLGKERIHLINLIAFGLPSMAVFFLVDHPGRFALALASILFASWVGPSLRGQTLMRERNFFAVSRVERDAGGLFHQLYHGSTIHGRQFIDPKQQRMPLSYYHVAGPLKQIMGELESRKQGARVAVIGLGAGAMAAYAKPGQHWTFYEIDPVVIKTALNTNYFTYLAHSRADSVKIVQGDARLRLAEAKAGEYDLIVLDAFSSDSVPVHLLTREAMLVYLSKLTPNGLLGFHVSNRNLDVKSVVTSLSLDAGLISVTRDEESLGPVEMRYGKDPAQWAMASRVPGRIPELIRPGFWEQGRAVPGLVWADDYSSVWRAVRHEPTSKAAQP